MVAGLNTYVTGLHRAGTHTFSETLAKTMGLFYIEEHYLNLFDFEPAENLAMGLLKTRVRVGNGKENHYMYLPDERLEKGFVCQCPFLAYKTLDLAKLGKVYWCTRNHQDIVTSMKNGDFSVFSWDIMKAFYAEFPDDPIWGKLTYDGHEDIQYGFVQHFAATVKVREYFYNKYFKDVAERIVLEDQNYYQSKDTGAYKNPIKHGTLRKGKEALDKYESICFR